MDHETLRLFLTLARTLHFGRASRECHISPSTLSRSIRRLETDLGWPLFERNQREVSLTAQGHRFREYALETLERWERFQVELDITRERELTGTISLYASVTACYGLLPRLLGRFRERHPGVHIELQTGDSANALSMLRQGVVDLTVAAVPERLPKSVQSRTLKHTPLIFVAPTQPCAVSRALVTEERDWTKIPLIVPKMGLGRELTDRWFKRQKQRPNIYGEVSGHEGILALVSLGCGVGIVPQLVLERSPLRGELRIVDDHPMVGGFEVAMCTRRRKLEIPHIRAFWDSMEPDPVPQLG